MATYVRWLATWTLLMAVGCHSSGPGRPLPMLPPAPIDDTPRPVAAAPPRGIPGSFVSTAIEPLKKIDGQEEAMYQFPIPPAPTDFAATLPQTELPLPPAAPISPPPSPILQPPSATIPIAAPPPAESTPVLPAKTTSFILPPATPSPAQSSPPPMFKSESSVPSGNEATTQLRALLNSAKKGYAGMDTYQLRMRRREVVAGKARPEELIHAKFRREPFSIYLKWLGDEGKGREVCYVKGQHEDLVHTLMAAGDLFLFAGKHFKVAPDSPLVKSNCRYPITDAGFGPMIARFDRLVTALDKGDVHEGSAKHLGRVKRPEFAEPLEGVVQTLPPNYDGLFPGGGQRHWYFEVAGGLPVLVITFDHQGQEVEYYCHDRIQSPGNLDNDDFDPYRLWKAAKG